MCRCGVLCQLFDNNFGDIPCALHPTDQMHLTPVGLLRTPTTYLVYSSLPVGLSNTYFNLYLILGFLPAPSRLLFANPHASASNSFFPFALRNTRLTGLLDLGLGSILLGEPITLSHLFPSNLLYVNTPSSTCSPTKSILRSSPPSSPVIKCACHLKQLVHVGRKHGCSIVIVSASWPLTRALGPPY